MQYKFVPWLCETEVPPEAGTQKLDWRHGQAETEAISRRP
jgi:hypothetical protein